MGLQIEPIETQERYEEYVNYLVELHSLLEMNPDAIHLIEMINTIRNEVKTWDNK
jgi:hypothetical protein